MHSLLSWDAIKGIEAKQHLFAGLQMKELLLVVGGRGASSGFLFSLLASSVSREGKSLICLYALLITSGWLCCNLQRPEVNQARQDQLPLGWQLNINLNIPKPTGRGGVAARGLMQGLHV